ncbi:hypothetical protein TNCV_4126381 [Trichonephila clavipes]|nr:hypothetical protein TNCV_4126381 [Trichonephila clavipes]
MPETILLTQCHPQTGAPQNRKLLNRRMSTPRKQGNKRQRGEIDRFGSEIPIIKWYPFNHDDAINIERKRGTSPVLDVTDRQEWLSPSATSRSSENNLQH